MNIAAIVVAAGRGVRMGGELPKVLLPLSGTPILVRTLRALAGAGGIRQIVAVVSRDYLEPARELVRQSGTWPIAISFAVGGAERQDSVAAGLQALPPDADLVVIHDGARPFVQPAQVAAVVDAAARHGAALLAVPSRDTVKLVDGQGVVTSTPPRESVWLAQTPQAFRTALLRDAHARAHRAGVVATDDAALVERLGVSVHVVRGDAANVKITTPDDLRWAEWYLQSGAAPR